MLANNLLVYVNNKYIYAHNKFISNVFTIIAVNPYFCHEQPRKPSKIRTRSTLAGPWSAGFRPWPYRALEDPQRIERRRTAHGARAGQSCRMQPGHDVQTPRKIAQGRRRGAGTRTALPDSAATSHRARRTRRGLRPLPAPAGCGGVKRGRRRAASGLIFPDPVAVFHVG